MAYNTPELVMVGAAQNLVLSASVTTLKDDAQCVIQNHTEDASFEDYNQSAQW